MNSNDVKSSALAFSYKKVFGVKTKKLTAKQERELSEALEQVWLYEGTYPGETEIMKEQRLDMTTPAQGEFAELGNYLKNLPGLVDLKDSTIYDVVFAVYKRMLDGVYTKPEMDKAAMDEKQEAVTGLEDREASSHKTININNQEEFAMGANTNKDTDVETILNEMENEQKSTGVTEGSMPKETAEDTQGRFAALEKNWTVREQNSTNRRIKKFILGTMPLNKRVKCEEDGKAYGMVQDPVTALSKFKNDFCIVESSDVVGPDGNVTKGESVVKIDVRKIPQVDEQRKAVEMLNMLTDIAAGAENKIEIHLNKTFGTVKGFEITTAEEGKTVVYTANEFAKFLLTETANFLIAKEGIRAMVVSAKDKKKGTDNAGATEVQKKVRVVKITNRKDLTNKENESYIQYARAAEKESYVVKAGGKSELSFKWTDGSLSDDGKSLRFKTYRLPVHVAQLETSPVEGYEGFAGKGTTLKEYDLSNPSDVTELKKSIVELMKDFKDFDDLKDFTAEAEKAAEEFRKEKDAKSGTEDL